jgi:hypothetical protein
MRVAIFIVALLVLAGFLIADGIGMWGARQDATEFSNLAAQKAVDTYMESGGREDTVKSVIQNMAVDAGIELVDLSYHEGTTRWYEVTVRAIGTSYFLRHLPVVKDHLVQESRAVAHF